MCKVLLVDDEQLERHALNYIISKEVEGVKVVGEACSGRQAISLCEEVDPDIIFMDIKMPVMNGIEATKIIKSKDKNKIVIMVTAYDDFKLAQNAIKAKADDYILKPARPELIIDTIKRHIDNIKSRNNIDEFQVEKLTHRIKSGDLKGAKDNLKELFNDSLSDSKDNVELRENIKKILDCMIDLSIDMNLRINKIHDEEFNLRFLSFRDSFEIRNWLFQILDNIFYEMIENKNLYYDNYLLLAQYYIEKNYHKGITLEDVSKFVNLSSSYLSKLFKKENKINISTYITNRRIERAKELLEDTDLPISNIAMDLSYNESNYFSKVFKRVVGVVPTEYRNKNEPQ